MRLLLLLADAFVDTFGITRPSPTLRRRAAWFIAMLLVSVLLIVLLAVVAVRLATA